ncbi:nitrate- and nitrite sensing domain-containing protein [Streptomyces sp. HNM0663]|uniref:histidine kinase n=1 Tax=Streptomyces chengmaiensis TaxID=3040919 RepID=A0ABT6HUZ7_9ACTN|nr:nitrate- and nitrite sensing domain-containing protein [Streptomyces chengmaiensis]MDH2392541.1 nitrate- and nitrite sensing domain-containing protein [Streptomyces chengmaiensis]
MLPRPRTVRAKIISLLTVPVVSLLALWGFATVTTVQEASALHRLQTADALVGEPVAAAVAALQDERRAAVRQLAAPSDERATAFEEESRRTDRAVARLRLDGEHTVAVGGDVPPGVAGRLEAFVEQADGLRPLRARVAAHKPGGTAQEAGGQAGKDSGSGNGGGSGETAWAAAYEQYTEAVTAAFGVVGALSGTQGAGTAGAGADARVLLEFARSGELLAREDALLTAARLDNSFAAPRLREFTGAVAARRTLAESAAPDLPAPQRAAWRELTAQSAYRRLQRAEDTTLAAAAGRDAARGVSASSWEDAHTAVRDRLRAIEADARHAAADRADPVAGGVLTAAGGAVLLGLAAVAASLAVSVHIGRGLVVELVGLRNTALEIARRKLPEAMGRLRAGQEIDIEAEAPQGPAAGDEIGQVGEALGTVHRAALSAAVERAELAGGISGVFVNLARRSQILVHRQLALLDTMERRADDPDELGDLFRLDHLTTRMRRHAESLIILSGAAPGRGWRTPVPLTSVVRAAVSEIEDYARVEAHQLPETAISGAAVADVTHLLAELVENAAQFSPPHTRVRVSGEPVGNGYALEVEDRGLGMGKEALAEANRRLAESETLDLFDSDRLGLFVVSRLAFRHDIRVSLRTSPYGGTTAVVLLPTALLQGALTASPGGGRERRPERRPSPHPDPLRSRGTPVPGPRREAPPQLQAPGGGTPAPPPPAAPGAPTPPGVTALRQRGGPSEGPPGGGGRTPPTPRSPQTPHTDPPPHQPRQPQPSHQSDPSHHPYPSYESQGDELPRRVRQASLVPQLRQRRDDGARRTPAASRPPEDGYSGAADRTPEQARARMAAYRDGWRRGGGPAPGDTTGPGTAPATGSPDRSSGSEGDHA